MRRKKQQNAGSQVTAFINLILNFIRKEGKSMYSVLLSKYSALFFIAKGKSFTNKNSFVIKIHNSNKYLTQKKMAHVICDTQCSYQGRKDFFVDWKNVPIMNLRLNEKKR